MEQIDPSEILRKVEKGENVEYNDIFIKGYLDLSNLNLQQKTISIAEEDIITLGVSENKKVVKSKIKITNSEIKWIKCKDIIFADSVDFSGTEFLKPAEFSGTVFCDRTLFVKTNFFQVWFQGTKFCEDSQFKSAEFKTHADFRSVLACKSLDFGDARFGTEWATFITTFAKKYMR